MKEYIVKRLILMCFTLFGIVLITFCVTRLAPGDPASLKLQGLQMSGQGNQQLSRQLIEETRQLYGFDQPLLFNFRHDNVRTYTFSLIKRYISAGNDSERQEAETAIVNAGTVIFPFITEYLDNPINQNHSDTLFALIEKLSGLTFAHTLTNSEKLTFWHTYFSATCHIYNESWGKKMIQNLFSSSLSAQEDAHDQLVESGTASVALIMEAAEEFGAEQGDRLYSLLAEILRKPWHIESSMHADQKTAVLNKWQSWWKREKHKYTFFSTSERLMRIFSATQFGQWIGMVLKFDFGDSYAYHMPVTKLIKERLPISLQLSLISIFLTYIIAIPLGVFSATHQYTASDKIITLLLFILYSLPSFWIANMLILLTTGGDFPHIFPSRYLHSSGAEMLPFIQWFFDWIWHLILPITCLTYGSFAYVSRQMRVGMLDIIRQDFIRTARAKGLKENSVIFKHALRNALIPTVTLLAFLLPATLGGSVIIEEIFSIEGMGKLSFDAILNRDYPIINAIAFFSAFLTLLGILITDVLYVCVDPRISFEK